MKYSQPSSSSTINPPLFLTEVILPSIVTSSTSSPCFLMKSSNLAFCKTFLCEIEGRSPLTPVMITGSTSPALYLTSPFTVISDKYNLPSIFCPTSTRTLSLVISTITPSTTALFSLLSKDSFNIFSKSNSSPSSISSIPILFLRINRLFIKSDDYIVICLKVFRFIILVIFLEFCLLLVE